MSKKKKTKTIPEIIEKKEPYEVVARANITFHDGRTDKDIPLSKRDVQKIYGMRIKDEARLLKSVKVKKLRTRKLRM